MGAPGPALSVVLLLPEFAEGGVERHVLALSDAYAVRGHRVLVVSRGGPFVGLLSPGVHHMMLPVHAKNPLSAAWSAWCLARRVRWEGWQLLHAQSRVPAWVAWWTSVLSGIPWGVTAQSCYSCNLGVFPFRRADFVVACSEAVRCHQEQCQPGLAMEVIPDGVPDPGVQWRGPEAGAPVTFLFAGRLTAVKGIDVAVDALLSLPDGVPPWRFLVLGDGPLRGDLEERVRRRGDDRVQFLGFREDVFDHMATASCLLFPSRVEGMPLALSEALRIGIPVLASDIPAVRGMVREGEALIPAGDVAAWRRAVTMVLEGNAPRGLTPSVDFGFDTMVERYLALYRRVLGQEAGGPMVRDGERKGPEGAC